MTDLHWDEIVRRFGAARNWWIGTTGRHGPHSVPVWGVAVHETLCFYGAPDLVRSRNLAADPRLVVHLEDAQEPLILHGRAVVTGRAQDRDELVAAYRDKYDQVHDAHYLLGTPYAEGVLAYDIAPVKAMAWVVTSPSQWIVRRWRANP